MRLFWRRRGPRQLPAQVDVSGAGFVEAEDAIAVGIDGPKQFVDMGVDHLE